MVQSTSMGRAECAIGGGGEKMVDGVNDSVNDGAANGASEWRTDGN